MAKLLALCSWACLAAPLALAGCGERGDAPPAATRAGAGPGQILYLTYCEGCHGAAGRGDGAAAASLRTPPADLTRLWERYGTPLDRERLAAYIDGRRLITGHAAEEMPIWGLEFFEDAPESTPNLEGSRRAVIDALVRYLETLQSEQRT
jgi:hypothetical protein